MSKAKFQNFLKEPLNRKALIKRGFILSNLPKVTSEIYIARHSNGRPICIFEIAKKIPISVASAQKTSTAARNSLLQGMPSFCLNLPGYHIAYSIDEVLENGPITGFHVKKFTPNERFVGDFSPIEFIKFLASTIAFCRKETSCKN